MTIKNEIFCSFFRSFFFQIFNFSIFSDYFQISPMTHIKLSENFPENNLKTAKKVISRNYAICGNFCGNLLKKT